MFTNSQDKKDWSAYIKNVNDTIDRRWKTYLMEKSDDYREDDNEEEQTLKQD